MVAVHPSGCPAEAPNMLDVSASMFVICRPRHLAKVETFQSGYSNIKNLVLWARSEEIGYALNQCHGMMEYWNDGILGLVQ